MFINDETVKLIELVRKQPALWNTKLKIFKDNNKKASIYMLHFVYMLPLYVAFYMKYFLFK